MSYNNEHHTNDIVRNVEDTSEETLSGRSHRAAKRRAARELAKTGRTVALALPWSRNRAARRHPAPVLNFEPDPNAKWRGGRMFLQRDRNRLEGRGIRVWTDEVTE